MWQVRLNRFKAREMGGGGSKVRWWCTAHIRAYPFVDSHNRRRRGRVVRQLILTKMQKLQKLKLNRPWHAPQVRDWLLQGDFKRVTIMQNTKTCMSHLAQAWVGLLSRCVYIYISSHRQPVEIWQSISSTITHQHIRRKQSHAQTVPSWRGCTYSICTHAHKHQHANQTGN